MGGGRGESGGMGEMGRRIGGEETEGVMGRDMGLKKGGGSGIDQEETGAETDEGVENEEEVDGKLVE